MMNIEAAEKEPLKEKKETNKTFKERLRHVKDNITLEPILACYVIPGVLCRLATQNLNLDKACRVSLAYGDEVCDALIAKQNNKYQLEELAVQELVASMEVWKNVLLTAIPSFLILFLGAWSDRTKKRKVCILVPIVGDVLMCLSNILSTYYFYEISVQVTMFFEAFFPAITGGWIATYMGAFSYISDISSEESRTFRIGIANLCLTSGIPIGSALSGILLDLVGYYGVFGVSTLLYVVSLVYGFFYIHDPENVELKEKDNRSSRVMNFVKVFFDVEHVKNTVMVAFKKGPKHRRLKSILIFAAIGFVYGPVYGEFTVRYLYTRYKFNWDALKYSLFNTFYVCVHSIGALISISVLSRRWGWDDSVLGLISNCSHMVGAAAIGLAGSTLQMYLAAAAETFNATSFTALRSMCSKLVASDELGKMISLFNLMEILTSLVFGPLYSWLYMLTLGLHSGSVFFVSAGVTAPAVAIFGWFYLQSKVKDKSDIVDTNTVEANQEKSQSTEHKEIGLDIPTQA